MDLYRLVGIHLKEVYQLDIVDMRNIQINYRMEYTSDGQLTGTDFPNFNELLYGANTLYVNLNIKIINLILTIRMAPYHDTFVAGIIVEAETFLFYFGDDIYTVKMGNPILSIT